MNLLSFLFRKKKQLPEPPPLPSWSEAVSVMYKQAAQLFWGSLESLFALRKSNDSGIFISFSLREGTTTLSFNGLG